MNKQKFLMATPATTREQCISALLLRGFTCLKFLPYLFSLDSLSEILFLSLADKSDFVRLSDFFSTRLD